MSLFSPIAISYYGLLALTARLSDSQDNALPRFSSTSEIARFGLKLSQGDFRGRLELAATHNNKFIARAAWVGLQTGNTEFFLGRSRPGGANAYGTDAGKVPEQYSGFDGIRALHTVKFSDKNSLKVGIGYGDSYGIGPVFSATGLSNVGYNLFNHSLTSGRVFLGSIAATVQNVDAVLYSAYRTRAVVSLPNASVAGDKYKLADYSYSEVSLGYRLYQDALSIGTWYTINTTKKLKKANIVAGNISDEEEVSDSDTRDRTVLGVGLHGNTSFLGIADILKPKDHLIYGLGWDRTRNSPELIKVLDFKHVTADQLSASVGYEAGGLNIFTCYSYKISKDPVFSDKLNHPGVQKSASQLYIKGQYTF